MKTTAKIILGILSSLFAVSVFANTARTSEINHTQARQQHRIAEGVNSGQLTPREAIRLERGQAKIANMKRVAKADGVVTHEERAMIKHAQRHESRKIYNKKHNFRTQGRHHHIN